MSNLIRTPEQLAALFGEIAPASLKKEVDFIHPHYQALIEASPFAVLATSGSAGLDASPRGDPPGFVAVQDPHTLLLPERRGNNRADSLRNLLADPRIALLFLIPGVGETLRVNGRADISVEPALLQRFAMDGKLPKCVLVIQVETVFFQCARGHPALGPVAACHRAARGAQRGHHPAGADAIAGRWRADRRRAVRRGLAGQAARYALLARACARSLPRRAACLQACAVPALLQQSAGTLQRSGRAWHRTTGSR